MKSGAGEDPFATDDETPDSDESGSDADEAPDSGVSDGEPGRGDTTGIESDEPTTEAESDAVTITPDDAELDGERPARERFPLKLRRNTVKDERPEIHQVYVQAGTDRRARLAEGQLERELGEEVYRLDAREAIYLAGLQNLDDAAAILRKWGYDL